MRTPVLDLEAILALAWSAILVSVTINRLNRFRELRESDDWEDWDDTAEEGQG